MFRNKDGFTLLESLVTGAISIIIVMGMISLNAYFAKQQRTQQIRMSSNDFVKRIEAVVHERAEKILEAPAAGSGGPNQR